MKVIHILHSLKFSGAEVMYVNAAPFFQEIGCELTVMATAIDIGEYAYFFKNAGYKVIHIPIPESYKFLSSLKFYSKFVKLLKNEKYNVVHIHSHKRMWHFSLCAWIVNVKALYTFHNVYPTHFYSYPYHCIIRWSAKYIFKCRFQTISDSVYNHELNYYYNKTIKIYNWYRSDQFFPATSEEKLFIRKDLGIENQRFIIISVGGCSPIKRHTEIIKALPKIIENIPNCLYIHLGKGISETEEMQLAIDLGISEYIMFCGNQSDVRKYLIASDVYIMTSSFEGISLTTIEAMACNIPTILYNVPGLRDFNSSMENSFLIEEDFTILAEKVVYLYNNIEISFEIANRANDFVVNNFNMRTNAKRIYELYIN